MPASHLCERSKKNIHFIATAKLKHLNLHTSFLKYICDCYLVIDWDKTLKNRGSKGYGDK